MGRIEKNNCDYFPHLTTMRNHRKVKALRNKFGQVLGYAFWSMVLEYLTEQDGNEFEYSDFEIEMFASELSIEPEKAREMLQYCIDRELLFLNDDHFIYSASLNTNLEPVYSKRMRARKASETRQRRENGSFCDSKATSVGISVTEKPQSIEENSKEDQSKEEQTIPAENSSESEVIEVEAEEIVIPATSKKGNSKKKVDSRIIVAEDVTLSEIEYNSLRENYGEVGTNRMIQILSNYKGASGKSYKSDYKAILNWVVSRYQQEANGSNKNKQNSLTDKARNADAIIDQMYGRS